MASTQPLRRVCLVGANGFLGSVILRQLLDSGDGFQISVLRRTNSRSSGPGQGVREISVSPELKTEEVTRAFTGQDAVVVVFPVRDVALHLRLAEAACRAGVQRFIPADFGSDSADESAQLRLGLFRDKTKVRKRCEELAAEKETNFSWTSIVCGLFFDDGIREGYQLFDLDRRHARLLDGGTAHISTSTVSRTASATVATLLNPVPTRNRIIYVQSFCPSQLETLAELERVTGAKWSTETLHARAFLDEQQRKLEAGDLSAEKHVAVAGPVISMLSAVDWPARKRGATGGELLALPDEVLSDVVAEAVAAWRGGGGIKT
ncbi:hypothetical protein XA68_16827 [Ophiocordyceps unilateralis]|uniref:NAD(P)-binding domain-containing protein n=1 Tax=Ophiocordyceps unilateralis TaxID=268505 RepID=A0A2A9P5K2_OPHUN|nr:hypothetical protein XA68_16827 [Ophiocordyceps unilateralis]